MAIFISMIRWTEQGARNAKDTVRRFHEAEEVFRDLGVKVVGDYYTLGAYDRVVLFEAPDDEALAAALLATCGRGNMRTETMRAFTTADVERIVQKAG